MAKVGNLFVSLILETAKFDASLKNTTRSLKRVGGSMQSAGMTMTRAVSLPIVAAGAAVAKFGLDFDKQMKQSMAIMGDLSDAMKKDMADAAKQVARDTTFSASQAAEAYFFLASAGLDASASVAAMPQVAKFAQAGMFDLARATDLATDAQSALGLTVRDDATKNLSNLTRVTDVLVKANTLANASVEQFSEALTTKAGVSLKMVNKDIEEGVAVLAAFADQGVKGQIAGTQFAIVMKDLQSKSIKNKEAFKELGVAVFDANGKMRNIADIVGNLEDVMAGMSDEQKKATLLMLGFSDKSVVALQTLIGLSDQIRAYELALRKAAGMTQEVADKQMEAFINQLTVLYHRIQNAAIVIFESLVPAIEKHLMPALKKGVEIVEWMAVQFAKLPGPIKLAVIGVLALAAALGPLLLVAGTFIMMGGQVLTMITALKIGFVALAKNITLTGSTMGGLSAQFPLIAGGIAKINGALAGFGLTLGTLAAALTVIAATVWANVDAYQDMKETIKQVAEEETNWNDITKKNLTLWENFKRVLAGPIGAFWELGESAASFYDVYQRFQQGGLGKVFEPLKDEIRSTIISIMDIGQKLEDSWDWLEDRAVDVTWFVIQEFRSLSKEISELSWKDVENWWDGMLDYLKDTWESTKKYIGETWTDLVKFLTETDWTGMFTNLDSAFYEWLNNTDKIKEEFTKANAEIKAEHDKIWKEKSGATAAFEDSIKRVEAFQEEFEFLNAKLEVGLITKEKYDVAMAKLEAQLGKTTKAVNENSGAHGRNKDEIDKEAEALKTLIEGFEQALSPMTSVSKEVGSLVEKFGKHTVISQYSSRILEAANAQMEIWRETGNTTAKFSEQELEMIQLALAFQKTKKDAERFREEQDRNAEASKRVKEAIEEQFKNAPKTLPPFIRDWEEANNDLFKSTDYLARKGMAELENALADQRREFDSTQEMIKRYLQQGKSAEEIINLLGGRIDDVTEFSKKWGVELDETTKQIIRMKEKADENAKMATEFEEAWTEATGQLLGNFMTMIQEMDFSWKGLADSLVGTVKNLGKTLLSTFISNVFKPILEAGQSFMQQLGKSIGNLIFGGGKGGFQMPGFNLPGLGGGGGLLGKIPGLGGLFGAATSTGLAGGVAAVSTPMALGGGLTAAGSIVPASTAVPAIPGLALGGGGGAGGGMGAAIAGLMTNPITIAVGAGLAAFFAVKKWWPKSSFEKLGNEVGRDFGLSIGDNMVKQFAKMRGISENMLKGIRADVKSSPKFFEEILLPAAKAAGTVDQLVASYGHLEAFGKVWDLQGAAAKAAEGDFTDLNQAWSNLFSQSQKLQEVLPNWKDLLLGIGEAAGAAADAVNELGATSAASAGAAAAAAKPAAGAGSPFTINKGAGATQVVDLSKPVSLFSGYYAAAMKIFQQTKQWPTFGDLKNKGIIKGMQRGGYIDRDQFAYLHRGETVVPRAAGEVDWRAILKAIKESEQTGKFEFPGGRGGDINITINSRSEDLVATVRSEVIPLLKRELDQNTGGFTASVVKAVNSSRHGVTGSVYGAK